MSRTIILSILLLAAAGGARAASVTPDRVRAELEAYVRQQLPGSVEGVAVDGINLREPADYDGDRVTLRFRPRPGEDFVGRTVLSMDVVREGRILDTRQLSFRVRGAVQVWTVATSVRRGAPVTEGALVAAVRDLEGLPRDALRVGAPLGVLEASRDLTEGTVLCRSMVRDVPDRERGTPVLIEIRTGALVVSCMGELLADATLERPARARCGQTGSVVEGVLAPGGRVVVAVPGLARSAGDGGGEP